MKKDSFILRLILTVGALLLFSGEVFGQEQSWKVTTVEKDEPGEKLVIRGRILLPDGTTPAPDARIWVFQTDAEGYYRKSVDGEDLGWRRARISHTFTAGPEGQFEIHTIKPAGYPGRSTPAHIHFRISTSGIAVQEHTIFFKNDDRITAGLKRRIQRDGQLYLVDLRRNDQGDREVEVELIFVES